MSHELQNLILVVDDNPANTKVLFDTLREAGHRVLVAKSGEVALERLQSATPDLILLDVMMPGIDGFETCRRLKADAVTQAIPVIFMTALADTEDKTQGFSLGAVDYITKPFQQEEVLARVHLHLQLYNLTQGLEQRVRDRTVELESILEQLRQSQLQLIQNEKMSALGNLIAGVAHEINNPVGFISGNLKHAQKYIDHLLEFIDFYLEQYPPDAAAQEKIAKLELTYLRQDLPKLISSMKAGTDRIQHISTSLRTFSRSDSDRPVLCNIHDGIDSTLLILKHRLKENELRPEIEIIKHFGDLPQIECYAGQLNQVFMNLIANAIDALEELSEGRGFSEIEQNPNQIRITTALREKQITVQIQDNGIGIAAEMQQQVFDHLFTTKEVGKGTGLGLAIAHQIITEKHQGSITVNSAPGQGTEFIITLPIQPIIKRPIEGEQNV
jgi:signal transduction histidine kinase